MILQALAIALVVRTLLFQPFNIPSGSMIPTLEVGDYLFVSKYSYGYSRYSIPFGLPLFNGRILASPPQRGDVVVFKLPRDNETDYIKRVIGMPGDKIEMKKGRLYINDTLVPREAIEKAQTEDLYGHFGPVPTYIETLPNGVKHKIIEIQGDDGFNDNAGPFVVPAEPLFHDGRQSRQFHRFACAGRSGRRRLCAVRKSRRPRPSPVLLGRRGRGGLGILALAADPAPEPHVPIGKMTGDHDTFRG